MSVKNIQSQHIDEILNIKWKLHVSTTLVAKLLIGTKKWARHICCNSCNTQLLHICTNFCNISSCKKHLFFVISMIVNFLNFDVKGFSEKYQSKTIYPSCQFALKLYLGDTDIPLSKASTPEVFENP